MSKDKKSIEVNQRPLTSQEKENELDKRRNELAKQKEAREKQISDEVKLPNNLTRLPFLSHSDGKLREKTNGTPRQATKSSNTT